MGEERVQEDIRLKIITKIWAAILNFLKYFRGTTAHLHPLARRYLLVSDLTYLETPSHAAAQNIQFSYFLFFK